MVEGSAFHCAVSAHGLKEEEEGAELGHRGSKHPQGRLSGAEKPQQSVGEREAALPGLFSHSFRILGKCCWSLGLQRWWSDGRIYMLELDMGRIYTTLEKKKMSFYNV